MKISIVTAVYNRAGVISQALESMKMQSWANVEHIIIDGVSTDGTIEILKPLESENCILVSEPDSGIYDALNKGFARATGDIIGLLHSDDFFADSQVLESVAEVFSNTSVDAVYGDLDYVDRNNESRTIRRWRPGEYHRSKLSFGWMPPHPTLFLRREVIERWGAFDNEFRIAGDYDAILRYFGKGGIDAAYIPRVLVKMRTGGESNRSIARIVSKTVEDYRALRRNRIGGLGALAYKNLSKVKQFF